MNNSVTKNSSVSQKNHSVNEEMALNFFSSSLGLTDCRICPSAEEAVSYLTFLYQRNVQRFRDALNQGDPEELMGLLSRNEGGYPYLGFHVSSDQIKPLPHCSSYGFVTEPGFYGSTITRPDLFHAYLEEQIRLLMENHGVYPIVGCSPRNIPISFLGEDILVDIKDFSRLKSFMSLPSLRDIHDSIANGSFDWSMETVKPLSLFSAERVDYSLGRLGHYCGTDVRHFQKFILLTNYQRYVDLFYKYACQVSADSGYISWVEPHDREYLLSDMPSQRCKGEDHGFQMPAYHLTRSDGMGITLVNIGVSPSNAKNVTDHLAVLRPHCWIIAGHCAGLRYDQVLGDYVLANGYVRNDHVLDDDLPVSIPVPAIAEIQQVLQQSISERTGMEGPELKQRVRTGAVVSTGNRNWELRIKELSGELNMSRAIALDMESATLAANGFRFRVPYGTLLCISDRPLHGEPKLQAMAKNFYQQRVQQHLEICIRAMELLRQKDMTFLHSRKLRGFQEPPFR